MEALYPAFEAAVVSIDMLDMKYLLSDVLTGRDIDGLMRQV